MKVNEVLAGDKLILIKFKAKRKKKMNPEEIMIAENHVYGIVDEQREKDFKKNYGRKAGSFTDRKQW